jgi:hypothetical protein
MLLAIFFAINEAKYWQFPGAGVASIAPGTEDPVATTVF